MLNYNILASHSIFGDFTATTKYFQLGSWPQKFGGFMNLANTAAAQRLVWRLMDLAMLTCIMIRMKINATINA